MLICVMASLEPSAQPSSSTERYLPGSLRIHRALVVDIQNQGSQGGAQPAKPQQDQHHHPGPSQPSLRPPRSWAALNPRWSFCQNGNSASRPGIAFSEREANLRWRKVCEIRRVRSDQRVPSETVYRRAPSFLSSSFLLPFLPSYPTQAPTNPLKSV